MGANEIIVLNAYRDGLRIAERTARRMTTSAGIVVVETARLVEPEQPAQIREPRIEGAPERGQELILDGAGETGTAQRRSHLTIEVLIASREGCSGQRCNAGQRK